MYATFDTDSSYFQINVGGNIDITKDVIELNITEEVGQITNGTITLYDPAFYYAKLFEDGNKMKISWGYKKRNMTINESLIKQKNTTELQGIMTREGLEVYTVNPKYNLANNGVQTTSISFHASENLEDKREMIIYSSGTKKDMIEKEIKKLGISANNILIKFDNMTDQISTKSPIIKNEKSYKYILRLAKEWQCSFMTGKLRNGNPIACFVDTKNITSRETSTFMSKVTGMIGNSKLFEYGIGATYPNVISGSIEKNISENGQGESINTKIVDGKTIITKNVIQQGQVITLQLDENKIKKFALERGEDYNTIMSNVLKAQSMESTVYQNTKVKDFFTAEKIETAPQGIGYSGSLEVIGDPTLCISMEAKFGYGFPPQVQKSNSDFKLFIKSVEHKLNAEGYKCNITLADVLTNIQKQVNAG